MRQRWITATSFVVASALLLGGVGYHISQRNADEPVAPSAAKLPSLPPAPLAVSLTSFVGDGRALVGSAPLVAVNAVGVAISEIRLYDGDTLVGHAAFESPVSPSASATFQWPALRTGRHVLHATATGGAADEVAHSAPVRIEVVNGLFAAEEIRIQANGLSVKQAAAIAGVDPATVTIVGEPTPDAPGGAPLVVADAAAPLPRGASLVVPAAAIAEVPTPAEAPAAGTGNVPVIAATIDNCVVTIATAGAELVVYETAGSGPGFTEIGSVSSSAPLVTGQLTPGQHVFVAGPPGAPASSAPVAVVAGVDCLAGLWSGEATLFDGVLTIEQPVDGVWMYIGVDGLPFQRVPAVGTVPAITGSADLGLLMPSLAGEQVRIEVWRPAPAPDQPATLVARSEATIPESEAIASLLGESASVNLFGVEPNGNITQQPLALNALDPSISLQWNATSSRVDAVLWQVLTQPLGGDDRNVSPPMMIATGVAGPTAVPGIDLAEELLQGRFPITADALTAGRQVTDGQPTFSLLKPPVITNVASLTPGATLTASAIDLTDLTSESGPTPVPAPGGQVWVRALPLSLGQIIGPPSNLVPVTLFDPDAPVPVTLTVDEVTFDPGYAPNYQLDGCIRVTDVPWEVDAQGTPITAFVPTSAAFYSAFYRVPQTYCPGDWDPPPCTGLCDFVEGIKAGLSSLASDIAEVWDVVAYVYNGIITVVVEIATQLNPFCLQARVAGAIADSAFDSSLGEEAVDMCTKIARVATRAVVSAVLSSFGLPPSLPTSDQLLAIAQGNLTVLAVEYLKQLGVPCDDMKLSPEETQAVAAGVDAAGGEVPAVVDQENGIDVCSQMVGAVINEVKKAVAGALQQQVAAVTGLPMPATYEPGFEVILEPRADYSGAIIGITATPNTEPPVGFSCSFTASATAGVRTTGSFEYTESLYLPPASGSIRFRFFTQRWSGTVHLTEGSVLYEGNMVTPSISADKRCLPTPVVVGQQPVKPPLGRWKPGEAN